DLDPTAPEVWAPIPGYPGYEASTHGRIRSWRAVVITADGSISGTHAAPRLLTQGLGGAYWRVHVRHEDGRCRRATVGPLILAAFVGPKPEGAVCCHFPDPDTANNRLENLRWDTQRANAYDALEHKRGCGQKITRQILEEMWPRLVNGETAVAVAR